MPPPPSTGRIGYLPRPRLSELLDALRGAGYRCVGPSVRDGVVQYGPIDTVDALPRGVTDDQAPGRYALAASGAERLFDYATGPQALKPLLFAPREVLWRAERTDEGGIAFHSEPAAAEPVALIGARACDLAALRLSDQHFLDGPCPDPWYAARRAALLVVAVNCARPAATCFCASTGDGPHASDGFDLCLTELDAGFVVRAGSDAGGAILSRLTLADAGAPHLDAERDQARRAAASQVRALPGRNLRAALFANLEHPRWEEVAERCLACGSCTSVCPTCFCHAEVEAAELGAERSEHRREWDSCFTQGHAHMHGYKVRPHIRQRYRQWLTHKLGSWHDQYGRSGCVGCGRCVTWCPVGIDLTEEASAICAGGPAPAAPA